MYFYLIGIDHKSATIDVREELYRRGKAISDLWADRAPHRTAILLTCNRMEIYGFAGCADDAFGHIAAFSGSFPDLSKHAYTKLGEAQVFRHALRLGSGLESQLNGEEQILAQLDVWRTRRSLPLPLKVLWDKTIFLSKKIRVESKLNELNANIATLVFDDVEKRPERKEIYEVVIVGTGNIAEVFAKYRPLAARLTFIANKNHQKARMLAEYSGGKAMSFRDLPYAISRSDIVIGATSSPHYVIRKEYFDKFPARRAHQVHVYDLAIPRDVDPAVGRIEGVHLHNLDTLEHLFKRHNDHLRPRVELASDLVENALEIYQEVIHENNR